MNVGLNSAQVKINNTVEFAFHLFNNVDWMFNMSVSPDCIENREWE